jgi:hypothetical protein
MVLMLAALRVLFILLLLLLLLLLLFLLGPWLLLTSLLLATWSAGGLFGAPGLQLQSQSWLVS